MTSKKLGQELEKSGKEGDKKKREAKRIRACGSGAGGEFKKKNTKRGRKKKWNLGGRGLDKKLTRWVGHPTKYKETKKKKKKGRKTTSREKRKEKGSGLGECQRGGLKETRNFCGERKHILGIKMRSAGGKLERGKTCKGEEECFSRKKTLLKETDPDCIVIKHKKVG